MNSKKFLNVLVETDQIIDIDARNSFSNLLMKRRFITMPQKLDFEFSGNCSRVKIPESLWNSSEYPEIVQKIKLIPPKIIFLDFITSMDCEVLGSENIC